MGVKGLYSLINCNPELLEPYFLHDETVVIDGWNIAFRLYLGSNLDCVYGGELLAYTDLVRRFVPYAPDARVRKRWS